MHDLPHSTRSVTDLANGRIYLPHRISATSDPRSPLLQAIASHVLGHTEPKDYGDFLRQRVETNYLAAALLLPEEGTTAFLLEEGRIAAIYITRNPDKLTSLALPN